MRLALTSHSQQHVMKLRIYPHPSPIPSSFGTIFGKSIVRPWDWGGVGVDPRFLKHFTKIGKSHTGTSFSKQKCTGNGIATFVLVFFIHYSMVGIELHGPFMGTSGICRKCRKGYEDTKFSKDHYVHNKDH
eukprot:6481522-Amphidinium_carterae.1